MKIKIFLLSLIILMTCGCTIQPRHNIDIDNQWALVFLGDVRGNRIRILNFDRLLAFNIYSQDIENDSLIFIKKLERPKLPNSYNFSPYGVEWIDIGNNSDKSEYKIIALDENRNEYIELKQIISVPDGLGGWKVIKPVSKDKQLK